MHLKENTLLQGGKYRIIRKLGQGGFGITYLAEQSGLGREVAIKEFFMSEYCDRDSATSCISLGTEGSRMTVNRFLEKFLKEARNIANLKHPNIIAIYDIFEENNTAYYVMEYHPEGSLWSLVDKQGAMNEKQALHYIQQVALALKHIHNHCIMHLDIKPENILIDENNNAILIDFGISKVYDKHATVPMHKTPRSSIVTFSPEYSPIEQYTTDGVAEFSPATDIYSLGATLFTLLTGNCPPTAVKLVESDYLAEKLILHKVSQQNIEAVVRSMAFTKEKRPQSIDEFLLLLNSNGGGYKEPKKPFNWKPLVGIIAAILCIVFAGVGINKCNDYRAEQQLLAATEKARQDSIAAVKRYNDSIAMVKQHNDSVKVFAIEHEVAEQQHLAAIEKAKARQDSIKEQQRSDSIVNLPGILSVTTNPAGATVTVAGKCIGNTPIEKYELRKGSYNVKITKDGYNTISRNITISNDPAIINIPLTKTEKQQTKNSKEKDNQNNKPTKQEIEKYYNDGVKAYNAGNYSDAVKWYRKAAEQGNANAQCNLGICYAYERGVTKDLNEATKWFRKAAEQGHAEAQCTLGFSYELGVGVTKDLNEAVKWYQQAANKGYIPAIKTLHRLEYKELTFNVNGVLFTMIAIKGGELHNEQDNHSANLYDYYLCETEVTQELWEAVMGSNPSYFKENNNPVTNINFNDCISFLRKLNELLVKQLPYALYFTLPTIDEWEYAARGGNKSKNYKYSGSNNIDEVAWYKVNSGDKTHPVKSKQPNELGLYDMSGNVMELCLPCYRKKYNPNFTTFYRGSIACGGCYYLKKKECYPYHYISISDKIISEGIGLRIAMSIFNKNLKYIVRE